MASTTISSGLTEPDWDELRRMNYQPAYRIVPGNRLAICLGTLRDLTERPGCRVFSVVTEESPREFKTKFLFYEDLYRELIPFIIKDMLPADRAPPLARILEPMIPWRFLSSNCGSDISTLREFAHAAQQHLVGSERTPFNAVDVLRSIRAAQFKESEANTKVRTRDEFEHGDGDIASKPRTKSGRVSRQPEEAQLGLERFKQLIEHDKEMRKQKRPLTAKIYEQRPGVNVNLTQRPLNFIRPAREPDPICRRSASPTMMSASPQKRPPSIASTTTISARASNHFRVASDSPPVSAPAVSTGYHQARAALLDTSRIRFKYNMELIGKFESFKVDAQEGLRVHSEENQQRVTAFLENLDETLGELLMQIG